MRIPPMDNWQQFFIRNGNTMHVGMRIPPFIGSSSFNGSENVAVWGQWNDLPEVLGSEIRGLGVTIDCPDWYCRCESRDGAGGVNYSVKTAIDLSRCTVLGLGLALWIGGPEVDC